MTIDEICNWLEDNGSQAHREGMERFAITSGKAYGVAIPILRDFAKSLGKDHDRARLLWMTQWREARLLAIFTDVPNKVSAVQAQKMAEDFDSWEMVDQAAGLFVEAEMLDELVYYFALNEAEFIRRTAFAMIAVAAVHQKKRQDRDFLTYLSLIEQFANDPRNFVKKAVNWSLRQIGKRSITLHQPALDLATKLSLSSAKSAQWIGKDAVRELTNPKIVAMIGAKNNGPKSVKI
jgi:3-methyladenine DNA glycosylase AlkD